MIRIFSETCILIYNFQALLLAFILFVVAQEPIIYVPVEDDKEGGGPLDAVFDFKIKAIMMLKEQLG